MPDLKVLIADDDDMSLMMLEAILIEEGISQIDKAYDGVETLELYEDALCVTPYTAVFLDITMPEMDGLEVLRQIRIVEDEADYRAVIIMATGDNTHETVVKAMVEHDADDHIGKPFNRDEIKDMLVRHGLV